MDEYAPNKWRKRPLVITAQRMREPFTTQTMEGELSGKTGDWLVTGVRGEQYPCDDGVFRQTYELAAITDERPCRATTLLQEAVGLFPTGVYVSTPQRIRVENWLSRANELLGAAEQESDTEVPDRELPPGYEVFWADDVESYAWRIKVWGLADGPTAATGDAWDHYNSHPAVAELDALRKELTETNEILDAHERDSRYEEEASESQAEADTLRAQVETLTRERNKSRERHKQDHDAWERERHRLKNTGPATIDGQDVWMWAGDGSDHPESLACSVVMTDDQLREFVADRAQVETLTRERDIARGTADNLRIDRDEARATMEARGDHVQELLAQVRTLREALIAMASEGCECDDPDRDSDRPPGDCYPCRIESALAATAPVESGSPGFTGPSGAGTEDTDAREGAGVSGSTLSRAVAIAEVPPGPERDWFAAGWDAATAPEQETCRSEFCSVSLEPHDRRPSCPVPQHPAEAECREAMELLQHPRPVRDVSGGAMMDIPWQDSVDELLARHRARVGVPKT